MPYLPATIAYAYSCKYTGKIFIAFKSIIHRPKRKYSRAIGIAPVVMSNYMCFVRRELFRAIWSF